MTAGELSTLLVALVAVGGFFLSIRSTSHNELVRLYESLKDDFEAYKKESKAREEKNEQQREKMEGEINSLTIQVEKYRRYINRLIAHLERVGEKPENMEE